MVITCAGVAVLVLLISELLRRDRTKAAIVCMILAAGWIAGRAWLADGGALAKVTASATTVITASAALILASLLYRFLTRRPNDIRIQPQSRHSRYNKFS